MSDQIPPQMAAVFGVIVTLMGAAIILAGGHDAGLISEAQFDYYMGLGGAFVGAAMALFGLSVLGVGVYRQVSDDE